MANKGFIRDWNGVLILPITRGELVLDLYGVVALNSNEFLAGGKDGTNGLPGLITAAERAMLSGNGSGNGGSLADLYTKIQYINNGIKVNNTPINFYTESNGAVTATPITIAGTSEQIVVGTQENVINIGLHELSTQVTTVTNILRSISVDKYGRVTAVTGAALTNDDIPEELTGKTIINSILSNCTTSTTDIGTDEKAVANIAYVEKRIQDVTGLATGALKFGGPLSTTNAAITAATSDEYKDQYFKVTTTFTIDSQYIYFAEGESVKNITVKAGDTLIRHPEELKLVYIPSADETVTRITVTEEDSATDALSNVLGDVTLQFSSLFEVSNPRGNVALISIPKANNTQSGYLSKEDYIKFSSYAENLATTYTSSIASGTAGIYTLGTITVGTTPYTIQGINSTYTIALENGTGTGTNAAFNPILKFTENGSINTSITFKGYNGIKTRKNGDVVELVAANEAIEQDVPRTTNPATVKYITIEDGYKFGVQLGAADTNGNVTQEGLTDFSQFNSLVNIVARQFEIITYSLKGSANETEYRYGNDKLVAAITLTI